MAVIIIPIESKMVIKTGTVGWKVDSIEVMETEEGYEPEAVAYLSQVEAGTTYHEWIDLAAPIKTVKMPTPEE